MRTSSSVCLTFLLAASIGCSDSPEAPTVVATPTPVPTPTPTPIPPLGTGFACGLPARPECGGPEGPSGVYGCCVNEAGGPIGRGEFESRVNQAIDILQGEQPGIFRGEEVLDRIAYVNGIARILEQRFGLCAKPGVPGDEVGVKNQQNYSEQYDVYLSTARIRRSGFVASCRPSRF